MSEFEKFNPEQQSESTPETETWKLPDHAAEEIKKLVDENISMRQRREADVVAMNEDELRLYRKKWLAEGEQIYIEHLAKASSELRAEDEQEMLQYVLIKLDIEMTDDVLTELKPLEKSNDELRKSQN
jgi:hypothetical protein